MTHTNLETTGTGLEVAVIGMAGMFPGAKNIQRFWDNLKNGKESISYFTESQLKETGVEPEELADPGYVKARAILEDIEEFDSSFFNISPPEAEVMDPQMRLFHRCSWEALEDAAYNPDTYDGLIGVYAGATSGSYWQVLMQLSGKTERLGSFAAALLTDKDNLCTRISYSLNLKGPALFVKSACSTSLVSIHYGIQGLLSGECDIALAGGVSIHLPQETGYRYQPGMVMSPDGHCRAFDSRAGGTVPGSGAGVVVLKRFDEAVADRDHIYAVVRGSAVNNDGAMKVGYTAPGVAGQAAVITAALQMAGVKPETVSYIETHGTATELGDPIEVEALKRAFNTPKKSFCALGSVKSNIGHLDSAAGVAGFIKTVLALKHKTLPPSLHFHTPNPNIDFIDSPFYINTEQVPWEHENSPLRAGVSSFGIGGTNAHIVLEEAPPRKSGDTNRNQNQVILLSARTAAALERMQKKLAVYIKQNPAVSLDDIAYSLQVGRKTFEYRSMHVVTGREEAIETLEADAPANRYTNAPGDTPPTTPGTAGIPHNPHHADAATQHQTRDRLLMETAVQWLYGKKTDWADYYSGEERNRAALPTYSFEPRRYPLNVPTIQKLLKSRHPDTWQSLTIPGSAPAAGTETEPESGESTAHREPRPPLDNEYAPPANALEEKIATLWQEFLGIEPIGIHDDFLQLGGDSLKAITLISRVQKEAKITVPLVEFFKRPTIAHLAGHTQKAPAAPYRALQAAEKREYYPLSAAQKGVYAQQQIDKTNTAYNVPQAFVIKPGLDKKTISKTLRRLIERHEGLRTSFIQEGGEPAMRIHNPGTILSEIEILDAGESQLEDGAIEKTVYGFIRPFELSRAPLMRTGVIQLENNSQLLLVDMHHLIRDGVGGEVFIDDFVSIYYGAALPPLPLQYKDYSIWQNSRQMTRQRKKQGDYWHNLYKGPVPRLDLPCDYPRPTQRDMKGDKIMFEIDGELSTRLDDFARATGTTLHMVMSAAFGILMSQYSRQEEIVIGSPVAGRNHPDLEKIIGMFVNMISVKYNTQKEKSITDYIAEVKKNTLNAMENQEYYFEELVTALGLQGDAGRNPLFDVVFSVENIETVPNETHRNPEIKESQIHPYTLKHVDTPFELILGAWKKDGIIKMRLTYATALFKTATIQRMTEDYREVLNQIADKTTGNLGDITLPHRFAAADMDIVEDNDEDFDF